MLRFPSALAFVPVALLQCHHNRGSLSLSPDDQQLFFSLFDRSIDSENQLQRKKIAVTINTVTEEATVTIVPSLLSASTFNDVYSTKNFISCRSPQIDK
jgi:hypothetical protein